MAIDPICGMTVDKTTLCKVDRDGQSFYFRSEHCRRQFLEGKSTSRPTAHHDHGRDARFGGDALRLRNMRVD